MGVKDIIFLPLFYIRLSMVSFRPCITNIYFYCRVLLFVLSHIS